MITKKNYPKPKPVFMSGIISITTITITKKQIRHNKKYIQIEGQVQDVYIFLFIHEWVNMLRVKDIYTVFCQKTTWFSLCKIVMRKFCSMA